jgi:hypothetical protein
MKAGIIRHRLPAATRHLPAACLIITTGCGLQRRNRRARLSNTAKVEAGAAAIVFGLGGIGLNVIQGLRLARQGDRGSGALGHKRAHRLHRPVNGIDRAEGNQYGVVRRSVASLRQRLGLGQHGGEAPIVSPDIFCRSRMLI